ncbi:ABC transporter permease [Pediococcus stilesii]|nr:ABC transporter permease [Pediococcus stilesii]
MKKLTTQLRFDGRRLVLRNTSFIFFSLLMPVMFYILFTKVMVVTNNSAEMKIFSLNYMGSMIVYSILITSLMNIATFLMRDREQGFLMFLKMSDRGLFDYYISMGLWSVTMSMISVVILGGVAVLVNGVSLGLTQWGALGLMVLIGQLPLLLLGMALSFIKRQETLGVVCNLITFPAAIVSGLWWPIGLLPKWLQVIGEKLPTYFLNDVISSITNHAKLKLVDFVGIGIWTIILLAVTLLIIKISQRRGIFAGVQA